MPQRLFQEGLLALRAGHWPSLFAAWLHFEVSFMVWVLVGALGVAISQDLGLSPSEKGLLVAVPLLGGALLRIIVGPFADQFGARNVGLGLLVVEAVALGLGWLFGTNFVQMLGMGILLGFAGASFAVALPIASQAYPPARQGFAMGVAAVGNSGALLATFFAPRLAEAVGWHNTFGIMLLFVAVTFVIFLFLVPSGTTAFRRKNVPETTQHASQAFGQPFLYWMCFFYAVTFGGFVGLTSFLPILLHDHYHLDMVEAGSITALCGLAGSIARPIGGHYADRVGGLRLVRYVLPMIAVSGLLLAGMPSFPLALSVTLCLMAFLGLGNGVIFQIVSLRYMGMMGTASGVIGAAGALGGFILPVWFGIMKDFTQSYGSGFMLLGVVALVAYTSSTLISRSLSASTQSS